MFALISYDFVDHLLYQFSQCLIKGECPLEHLKMRFLFFFLKVWKLIDRMAELQGKVISPIKFRHAFLKTSGFSNTFAEHSKLECVGFYVHK